MNFNGTIGLAAEDRPIDALLAAYAARTLAAPFAALVASHLELRPDNRAYVAALEAVHGVFLEELKPVPLAGRDRRLVNIFATPVVDPAPGAPTRLASEGGAVLPLALRRLAGCDYADLPWRNRSAGIREAMAAQENAIAASFVSVEPGRRLPPQAEGGPAVVLVLAGAVSDRNGYHEHGDIVFLGDDAELRAEGDVDCVCFVVTEGAAKPPGPLSRILSRVRGG